MNKLFPEIKSFIDGLGTMQIPVERRQLLNPLSAYVHAKMGKGEPINLVFICTHNSRRSQLCQVWAQVAAFWFDMEKINVFSGGTEVTAFHPNALTALRECGFQIHSETHSENPEYEIYFSANASPVHAYSKLYDDKRNPSHEFAAIMTCSSAEANCPFIPGAEKRISLQYKDPGLSDETSLEEITYRTCNKQIAMEMMYVFYNFE